MCSFPLDINNNEVDAGPVKGMEIEECKGVCYLPCFHT